MKNNNLMKALLNEGRQKEFNLHPDKVWGMSYEFYKFYECFKDKLYKNFDKHIEDTIDKVADPLCEFPLFCITAFATSYEEYKNNKE
jgi:uncharacterized HAD superfamily protein